jgi:hypothetical protein
MVHTSGESSPTQPATPLPTTDELEATFKLSEKPASSHLHTPESSKTPTIVVDEVEAPRSAIDADPQKLSLTRERIFLLTLCWNMFLTGWNSASLGPLLPTIQTYYGVSSYSTQYSLSLIYQSQIGYTLVSMLFVSQCCGTIPGSAISGYLTDKLGFGKVCNH